MQERSGEITTVGIVTRERLPSLLACLESYLANCRRHSRTPEFVVADDSAATASKDVRAALASLDEGSVGRMRYAGRRERTRFAEALAHESEVPLDVVQFALFGDERCALSTGANRNGLLLDTVDSLILSVDDDTRGQLSIAPNMEDGLSFFTGYDPTEFWFYPDRAAATTSAPVEEIDLLRCHETLLGQTVAGLGDAPSSRAQVAITLNGLVGDSGMSSPRYYLALAGGSRLRLLSSETAYQSALQSREIVRTVRRRTVSSGPFFMTTFFGLDNRVLVPPFFPVQRNSDGIFGLVLQRNTSLVTGFLPFALTHAPPPRTSPADAIWADADRIRLADVLIDCVLALDVDASLPDAARLARLGQHLRWLGSLSVADFDAFVSAQQQYRRIAFITALQTQLQAFGGLPTYWAADVNRMIERMSVAPAAADYTAPGDLLPAEGPDAARRFAQELVGRFGELLGAWPTIVAAARSLRARGVRMSEPVRDGSPR